MKRNLLNLSVFLLCLLALLISLRLFWNMGIYVDEAGTSPVVVCGGAFWLAMDWLRLALLAVATLLSGIRLFRK